jgi:molybdopterin-guanine dinucleotide biosynthesis protein A
VNCYILVGGASTRMGRSKSELFLDAVVRAASPVFERVIAVQRADGEPTPLETIFETPHDDRAPVFGVACALGHARERCFILGVDYPLITADVLRHIRARGEASNALLVAPQWSGKTQMLCAVWSPALLPRMEERIASKRYDLRGIAAKGEADILPEAELRARFGGEPLLNVNTPEELAQSQKP